VLERFGGLVVVLFFGVFFLVDVLPRTPPSPPPLKVAYWTDMPEEEPVVPAPAFYLFCLFPR